MDVQLPTRTVLELTDLLITVREASDRPGLDPATRAACSR